MVVMVQMKDYQLVAKKQGTKSIPPLSSLVLLFSSFVYSFFFLFALLVRPSHPQCQVIQPGCCRR